MSATPTPEERAQALVTVGRKVPGGDWFVQLGELLEETVYVGPYLNKAVAEEDAVRIRRYLAAVLREGAQAGSQATG